MGEYNKLANEAWSDSMKLGIVEHTCSNKTTSMFGNILCANPNICSDSIIRRCALVPSECCRRKRYYQAHPDKVQKIYNKINGIKC